MLMHMTPHGARHCGATVSTLKICLRWPHFAQGRVIKPGQKIHASVAFIYNYVPKATLSTYGDGRDWSHIVGKGKQNSTEWAAGIKDLLEMDLFDFSNPRVIIQQVENDMDNPFLTDGLLFMASIRMLI